MRSMEVQYIPNLLAKSTIPPTKCMKCLYRAYSPGLLCLGRAVDKYGDVANFTVIVLQPRHSSYSPGIRIILLYFIGTFRTICSRDKFITPALNIPIFISCPGHLRVHQALLRDAATTPQSACPAFHVDMQCQRRL